MEHPWDRDPDLVRELTAMGSCVYTSRTGGSTTLGNLQEICCICRVLDKAAHGEEALCCKTPQAVPGTLHVRQEPDAREAAHAAGACQGGKRTGARKPFCLLSVSLVPSTDTV